MSLEHLTKTQIILLALLASFVTSIATGIVTAALMRQAPPEVARTVDHIIEKTVQQVAPPNQTAATADETVKEIIVTDKEAAPAAIALAQKSIIKIFAASDPTRTVVARGIVMGKDGAALTSAGVLSPNIVYDAQLPGGSIASVTLGSLASSSALETLSLAPAVTSTSTEPFVPASIAGAGMLNLGASLVRIGGTSDDVVAEGMLAELPKGGAIQSDLSSGTPGAIVIDLTGAVVGMTTQTSLAIRQNFYTALTSVND
ncbi:MAG: hypothetical protein ACREGH_01760 [Minisyncoccia bacterium]